MKKKNIFLLLLLVGTLLLDQISKWAITSGLKLHESIPLIPNFFSLTYVQNTGAAWSMLEGKMIFFYIISVIAIIAMILYFRTLKEYQFLSKMGIVLMISGTLGNFIDRLFLNYVRDFLDFIIFNYDFPVFNVADMCLCIGIAMILLDEFMDHYGVGYKWKQKDTK
ncbi:MAG: signal peptidase II [Erysipelotrichia bacterium]|nr:signal peptidase II [Erysipelotrichia bacterium]